MSRFSVSPLAGERGSFGAATATGGFGQRLGGFVKRLGAGRAVVGDAGEQLDFSLGLLQELIAVLEVLDALLVAGQSVGQAELAVFEVVNDRFELGEGVFEGEFGASVAVLSSS